MNTEPPATSNDLSLFNDATIDHSTVNIGAIAGRDISITHTEATAYNVRGLPNPYLGLASFTYDHRHSYAGRTDAVQRGIGMLTHTGAPTLLFVTGSSGSGKSSFVQAGVIPALEQFYAGRHCTLRWAVVRPTHQPLAALRAALQQLTLSPPPDDLTASTINQHLATLTPADGINLIVVDQFEELFTQSDSAQRTTLLAWLSDLPPTEVSHTHIVATLRIDYVPNLFAYERLYECAKCGIDLRAMTNRELKQAIQQPLLQLGHQRLDAQGKYFEPALLDRLADEASLDAAYLPLLQVTLEDIWAKGELRLSAYRTLGDAIQQRADDVYDKVDGAAMMHLMLALVDGSSDDDSRPNVRRRRTLSELCADDAECRALIDQLATARLISISVEHHDSDAVQMVDIIHDSLIANWPRLRDAIAAERTTLQQRGRFEQQLREWQAHQHDAAYLLAGVHLAEAEALLHADDITTRSPAARDLIERSIAQREAAVQREVQQERRAKRGWQATAVILGIITLLAATYFGRLLFLQHHAAEERIISVRGLGVGFEQNEVTNERYRACVRATRCAAPARQFSTFYDANTDRLPITGVDALEAAAFCSWIHRRLPTYEEWNYAATQGHTTQWPWGNDEPAAAFARLSDTPSNTPDLPDPIGSHSRAATADGINDLIGNVVEWTTTSQLATNDQPAAIWDEDPSTLPERLIIQGGSYRITNPYQPLVPRYLSSDRNSDLGFRCVVDVTN